MMKFQSDCRETMEKVRKCKKLMEKGKKMREID